MANQNGMELAIPIIGTITNMIESAYNNELEQEATKEQFDNQMNLSAQNARLARFNWDQTNFEAQRRHMERAGLSVGLMYKQGGGQGVSATAPGNITKRNVVPMDIGSSMQMAIQAKQLELQQKQIEAQVANTNADTKNKEIQAEQATGVDLQTKTATLEQIKQETENKAIQNAILEYQREEERIKTNIAQETERDIIYQQHAAASKLMDEARSAYATANIDQATQDERIKQIEQTTKENTLRMIIMKLSGDKISMETQETAERITKLTGEIDMLVKEMENMEAKTANEKQKLILDKIANEFMYGDEAKAIRAFTAARQISTFWRVNKTEQYNPAKGGKR